MRSTSRAPPFTEKWFWFKADPQRTGAYAYASERVHSISFICRIIAVFLFAAQGRANARVHEPKVSSSALHRGCAASVILPTRHRASMLVFARPFSSSSLRRKCELRHTHREICAERSFLWNVKRREIRLSFFFPLEQEKKIYWNERKVSSGKEDSFSRVLCVVHRKLESFFSRILFDHIRVEKFSYLSSFLLLLLLLFFSQDKSFGFLRSKFFNAIFCR